jgi:hypothetical protein
MAREREDRERAEREDEGRGGCVFAAHPREDLALSRAL